MKKFLLILAIILATAVWGAWLIAVPEDLIAEKLEGSLRRWGLDVEPVGFRKGFFYNFTIDGLDIKRSGERLVAVDDVSGKLDLPSLLLLKAVVPFEGRTGGGALKGRAEIKKGGYALTLNVKGAELGETGIFELTGLRAGGLLSGKLDVRDNSGRARFFVNPLRLEPVSVMGAQLPLNMFDTMRGALYLKGEYVEIESLALEGRGVYARVKGEMKSGNLDIKLEFMPEEEVMPDALLSSLMGKYRVSRGHYSIPIKRKFEF
jgi:type II secretion system protein N